MKKKPFFVCDFREHFSALTDEQAGKIVKAIFNLQAVSNGEDENLQETYFEDSFLQAYWQLTKELVQKQTALFDKRALTSAKNGKKGGRPKKQKNLKYLKDPKTKSEIINNLIILEREIQRRKKLKENL